MGLKKLGLKLGVTTWGPRFMQSVIYVSHKNPLDPIAHYTFSTQSIKWKMNHDLALND